MDTPHDCKNKQLSDTLYQFLGKKSILPISSSCRSLLWLFARRNGVFQSVSHLFRPPAKADSCLWKWLNDNHIQYHIRIRENFRGLIPRTGRWVRVSWLFNNLRVGEAQHLDKIHCVNHQACYLSSCKMKGKDGMPELQILISHNKPEEAVDTYRLRWQIETMLKAIKVPKAVFL